MAAQALYRRWRSQTFEDVVGQEHISLTLRNALREGRMSHAYLFTGPRGTGKTSTARILAKAINCLDEDPAARPCNHCRICNAITDGSLLDLIEIDAASNRGIDEIRDLREKIGFRPSDARYKVYIIDEVHMLTKEAFNALLKTLEEPPAHAVFVLATTEPDRVPETVRSRCQRFDFRRIPTARIVEHLQTILEREGGQAAPEALAAIARRSTGSMRDAISLLDQLLSYGDEIISLERVSGVLGLVDAQMIGRLFDAMSAGDGATGLTLLNQMVAQGVDLSQLVDQIVGYLRAVLFVQVTRSPDMLELTQEVAATVARQAEAVSTAFTLNAIREFLDARAALREQVPGVPQLSLELALVRTAMPPTPQTPGRTGEGASPGSATEGPVAVPLAQAPAQTVRRAGPASDARPAVGDGAAVRSGERPVQPPAEPARRATPDHAPQEQVTASGDLARAAQQNWDRFLALVGKRCGVQVKAALRSVKTLEVAGSVLVLQWPPVHKFSHELVNKSENHRQVEQVWEEVLGRPVQIRCTIVGEAAVAAPETKPESDDEVFLQQARSLGAQVKRLD